jgi:hypothetical protein
MVLLMPKSVDSSIYGTDSTSFAEGIATDALTNTAGTADFWGGIQDERGVAKANVGRESTGPSDPDTPTLRTQQDAGNFGDNEALNMPEDYKGPDFRHRKGPSTSTDEGAAIKYPPPKNQTGRPGKLPGPAFSRKVTDTGDGVS